jgi:PAS domain S-box-containing protein
MSKNKLAQKAQEIDELESASVRDGRLVNAWRDLWAQYAAMIEAFDGLIYICSQDYEIEFMNHRFIDRTGYYAIGQKCYKAIHDREEICPWCVNESVFQGETVRWEMRSPKDNRWYYIVNTPILHSDGTMSKMAMLQDITERKEIEEALRLAETDYRGIIENAVEGVFRSRPDGHLICVNPAMAKIHGYDSPEEMVATIKDVEHQLYVDPGRRAIFKRLMEESGQVRGFEYRGYRKDHSQVWISINARVVKDDRGDILYYEGFVEDITARKGAEEALLKAHDKLEDQVVARTRELGRVNQELRLRLEQLERAEAALRDERQRLYSLLNGLPGGVHLVAPDYSIRFANRVFWEDFRGKSDGQPCYRLIHGREHPCEDCHAARIFETGIPQRFEEPRPNNKILQVSSYPFADIDGSPLVLVLGMDITEQRRAEEKLRESEGRFRQLIEQAADAIFLHDQGKIIEVNQRACDSLGYTREELLGMSIFDLEVGLAKDLITKNWQLGNKGPQTIRGTHRRKDGTTFPVEVRAGNFEYGEHRLRLNLVRDISERVQAELALKESEEKYRLLVNQIPAVVFKGYADWSISCFDRKIEALTGYAKEDFNSRRVKWSDLIPPEEMDYVKQSFGEALRTTKSYVREHRIRKKNGDYAWVQCRGQIFCDPEGNVEYISGVTFDITKRKQGEAALGESEKRYRLLAENVTDVIWTADLNLRLTYVSPSVKFLRGFTPEEVLGQRLEEILTPASLELACRTLAETVALEKRSPDPERSWTLELEHLCKDGSTVWTESRASFLRDVSGHPVGILGITRDISKRREAEEALKESEARLRYLANQLLSAQENERKRLAVELHDELGHALLSLKLHLSSIEKRLLPEQEDLKKEIQSDLEYIQEVIQEVRRLYQDLSPGDVEDLGLTKALRNLINDFAGHFPQITWKVDLADLEGLFPLSVQTIIYRVLQEALTNIGKHSHPENVTVTAGKEGARLRLTIQDDGQGFDVDRVLGTPGRGVGLAAMKERLNMVGGTFEIHSRAQEGTKLSLTIPTLPTEEKL